MSRAVLLWDGGSMSLFTITVQHLGENTVTEHPVEKGVAVNDHVRPNPRSLTLECFLTNTPLGNITEEDVPAEARDKIRFPVTSHTDAISLPVIVPQLQSSSPFSISIPQVLFAKRWINPLFGIPLVSAFTATSVDEPFVPSLANPRSEVKQVSATVLQFDSEFNVNKIILAALEDLRSKATLLQVVTSEATYDDMVIESFTINRNADTGTGSELTLNLRQLRIVSSQLTDAPVPVEARGSRASPQGTKTGTDPSGSAESRKSLLKSLVDALRGRG